MTASHRPILFVEDNPMDVGLTKRPFARHKLANPVEVAAHIELYRIALNTPPKCQE